MTEQQVDACLVSTVAMYLGVRPVDPDDPFGPMSGDFAADAARLNRARLEAAARKQEAKGDPAGVAH